MALTAAQQTNLQSRYTAHKTAHTAAVAAGVSSVAAYTATEIRDLQFAANIAGGSALT